MIVLKTTQDKLLSVLQSVSGIVERRHTLPVLANVMIRKTGSAVQLTTSDLEIQIRTTAQLDGDAGDFTTTVGARKLIDILRTMPVDQTVSLESSQSKVILKGGKSKFTLQTLPAEDFPLVQEAASFGPAFSVRQKALQFEHSLARQNNFLLDGHSHIQSGRGKGQSMTIGRHQAEFFAFCDKQDSIEVITDVMNGHGKGHLAQQGLEGFLRHAERGAKAGGFLHQRKVFGRQGLQRELGFATLQNDFALARFEANGLVSRHGAQDVNQFAGAHGGGEVACVAIELGGGADLDFQIAGGQLHRAAGFPDHHVGQNGQGVAPLHNA
jgi:hypothetical protein